MHHCRLFGSLLGTTLKVSYCSHIQIYTVYFFKPCKINHKKKTTKTNPSIFSPLLAAKTLGSSCLLMLCWNLVWNENLARCWKKSHRGSVCDTTKGWIPELCVLVHSSWKVKRAKYANIYVKYAWTLLFFCAFHRQTRDTYYCLNKKQQWREVCIFWDL